MIMTISSIVPQIWLVIVQRTNISFLHLMTFWMCLSAISLFVGIWQLPWHNLPNGEIKSSDLATLGTLKRKKADIFLLGPNVSSTLTISQ